MEPVEDEVVTEVIEIPTLFDESRTVVGTHKMTPEEAFRAFLRRNPRFMLAVAEQAYDLWGRGNTRLSMKGIYELLRMKGEFPMLDNSHTSLCARRLVEDHPDLAHLFVTRKRRGE